MKRFIKLPIRVFELDLSPAQLLVYAAIISLKSKNNFTIASAKTISRRCGMSVNSVYTAVNALVSVGLVNKTNYIKNGKKASNGYSMLNIGGKFVKIEYEIFKKDLKPSEFAAYVAIKSKCNKSNRAYPSLKQISRIAHICIDTVITAVRELCVKGFLVFKHYIRKCGCYGHNNYILFDETTVKVKHIEEKVSQKKAFSFFNNYRYSKFWATLLEPFKNIVRNKINTLSKVIHSVNLHIKDQLTSSSDRRLKFY